MILFKKCKLKEMELRNHIIHSATHESLANGDGTVSDALIALNRDIAYGGVGMNVVGNSYVHYSGKHLPTQTGIDKDEMIPGLSRLAKAIRNEGAKACIQISHCGVHGNKEVSGYESKGPSEMVNKRGGKAKAMAEEEIWAVIEWFADAGRRARDAGFDAVQIHAGHGYLVSAFLSPYYNKREDLFGGSIENRARVLLEILRGIKREAGADFPVLVKLTSSDEVEGGITHDMMLEIAKLLERNGIDAIELTSGCNADAGPFRVSSLPKNPKTPEEEGYYKEAARKYKEVIKGIPLISVGGYRTPEGMEKVLQEGIADFISISRPIIREPYLIRRWVEGDTSRAKCVSCNRCMEGLGSHEGIFCPLKQK